MRRILPIVLIAMLLTRMVVAQDLIPNQGQWEKDVRYRAQLHNATVWLEDDALTLLVRKQATEPRRLRMQWGAEDFHHFQTFHRHAYRMVFVGAQEASLSGQHPESSYNNYYIGNDPSRWVSHVPLYKSVRYEGIYPGIDLMVYTADHALRYDFIVQPGAHPEQICLRYDGVDKVKVKDGQLELHTSIGTQTFSKPFAYQETNNGKTEVACEFVLQGKEVRFIIGNYNKSSPLVIDPTLIFSTYTGSEADNWGTTATYDSYKNTYTAGLVFEEGYPYSLGAYDTVYHGNADIGIFKFDPTGTQRLFATYLGGDWADMPHSLFVNTLDELIIFGTTGSHNFPVTPNAYCNHFCGGTPISYLSSSDIIYFPLGSDIFISRFSSDGSRLDASTFLGGNGNDGLNYRDTYNASTQLVMYGNDSLYYNYGDGARGEIITDDQNNVYVGSTTFSTNFPTTENCIQDHCGGRQDGIVAKLDYNLSNLIWSTYLGGSSDDAVYSIDVDSNYNLVVCGGTNSYNFPVTQGTIRTTYGGGSADGFITKISRNGGRMMASSYYGSIAYDQCYFVRCGSDDDIYIFGQTLAPGSLMIYNANYNVPGAGMLLARLTPDLRSQVWSTVFGVPRAHPNLSPTAFAVDVCDRIYAAGWGRDFAGSYYGTPWNTAGTTGMETTADAYQSSTDGQDFYIISLDDAASHLEYATFFGEPHTTNTSGGGDHVDGGTSRFDRHSSLYQSVCASCGNHNEFPTTPGAWSDTNASINCNNAIFRFQVHDDFPVAEFVQPPVGCTPYSVHFENTGRGSSYLWDFGDGTTSTANNPTHQYDSAGLYTVRQIAYMVNGCRTSDTIEHQVLVLDNGGRLRLQSMACSGEKVQIGLTPMAGCTYQWLTPNVSDPSVSNPWVEQTGDYVLQVSINGMAGCHEQDTFRVNFISLLDTLIIQQPRCSYDSIGAATALLLNDVPDSITFTWDDSIGDSTIAQLAPGAHVLVITSGGCEETHDFDITVPAKPRIIKECSSQLCNDSCSGWIQISFSGHDTLLADLCEGTYTTTLVDSMGCTYFDTTTILVQHSLDNFRAWADDTTLFFTQSTHLHSTVIPGCSYLWEPAATLDDPTHPNVLATPIDTITQYYVTVTDSAGCTRTDSLRIYCSEVDCGNDNIFIPNAFSPNGDGVNDKLCFRGDNLLEFHFYLYTRWGELVWSTNSIDDCWDGRFRDNWCMPGVYMYVCKVRCETDIETIFKGDITLIR